MYWSIFLLSFSGLLFSVEEISPTALKYVLIQQVEFESHEFSDKDLAIAQLENSSAEQAIAKTCFEANGARRGIFVSATDIRLIARPYIEDQLQYRVKAILSGYCVLTTLDDSYSEVPWCEEEGNVFCAVGLPL